MFINSYKDCPFHPREYPEGSIGYIDYCEIREKDCNSMTGYAHCYGNDCPFPQIYKFLESFDKRIRGLERVKGEDDFSGLTLVEETIPE